MGFEGNPLQSICKSRLRNLTDFKTSGSIDLNQLIKQEILIPRILNLFDYGLDAIPLFITSQAALT